MTKPNLLVENSSTLLKKLIDMIVLDINGQMCDDELVCPLTSGWYVTFRQCEDGIMYDIYNGYPDDDLDSEIIDGGCLECSSDEKEIDILDFISKLAFFSPS